MNIHANEGVPSDIRFTSAATNDSFMLAPSNYAAGEIVAMDRAYVDYTTKFEELTRRGVVYVTKMKKKLVYETVSDTMYMLPEGVMAVGIRHVVFTKHVKGGNDIRHNARIITYPDLKGKKPRLVSLLTNDMETDAAEVIAIYRKRWEIELLFKQLKQNFPLRYFYGESANAIKNRKPAADGTAEAHQTHVELLRTGHNGQNHAHVLRQLLHFLRESGKGLGRNT